MWSVAYSSLIAIHQRVMMYVLLSGKITNQQFMIRSHCAGSMLQGCVGDIYFTRNIPL